MNTIFSYTSTSKQDICLLCGNSSVVEHDLAKVGVASSNLVSRSIYISVKIFLKVYVLTEVFNLCPDGEIGRRKGLKIPRW